MLKSFLRRHCFKLIGAATGLIPGLGIFGLIFGLIAGAFVDQLTAGIAAKRRLSLFISSPSSEDSGSELFTATAALMTVSALCVGDAARKTLFASVSGHYFPKAPSAISDILAERDQDGLMTDSAAAAAYFGRHADDEQKNRLRALIASCGLSPAPEDELLQAAGISQPAEPGTEGGIEEDYAVLGLKPGAGTDEVKRVYHKLAAQFHPDGSRHLSRAQQKITEDAFIRIKSAYERLTK